MSPYGGGPTTSLLPSPRPSSSSDTVLFLSLDPRTRRAFTSHFSWIVRTLVPSPVSPCRPSESRNGGWGRLASPRARESSRRRGGSDGKPLSPVLSPVPPEPDSAVERPRSARPTQGDGETRSQRGRHFTYFPSVTHPGNAPTSPRTSGQDAVNCPWMKRGSRNPYPRRH